MHFCHVVQRFFRLNTIQSIVFNAAFGRSCETELLSFWLECWGDSVTSNLSKTCPPCTLKKWLIGTFRQNLLICAPTGVADSLSWHKNATKKLSLWGRLFRDLFLLVKEMFEANNCHFFTATKKPEDINICGCYWSCIHFPLWGAGNRKGSKIMAADDIDEWANRETFARNTFWRRGFEALISALQECSWLE